MLKIEGSTRAMVGRNAPCRSVVKPNFYGKIGNTPVNHRLARLVFHPANPATMAGVSAVKFGVINIDREMPFAR